jgi:hypothetical protein
MQDESVVGESVFVGIGSWVTIAEGLTWLLGDMEYESKHPINPHTKIQPKINLFIVNITKTSISTLFFAILGGVG